MIDTSGMPVLNRLARAHATAIVGRMRLASVRDKLIFALLPATVMLLLAGQSAAAAAVTAAASSNTQPVIDECTRIGHKLGSVSLADCLDRHLSDTGSRSVNGQAIMMKEYPPLPGRKPIGRILLIGGTHGDEYSAVSIVFRWMETLDRYHSGLFHWHVTPLLNPDGLLQKHSQRLNAHGVDLNRNMPTPDWYVKSREYWQSTGKDPRRYPGTAPLSEPESSWLYEQIRQFKPDAIVSVHAPFGVLDFDGPPVGPSDLGFLHLKLIGTYPGSLGNCAGVQHHIPVITVELPYAGIMPSNEQVSTMWVDLVRWLRRNIPKQSTIEAQARFDEIAQALTGSMVRPEKAPPAAVNENAVTTQVDSDLQSPAGSGTQVIGNGKPVH
ncbi:peptidase M14 [Mariprofundus ferrooxydans]|uniref:Peptidase M14, carboxypeptidase A n=2 Tax=Mariprofundus ferrooxydans TaxID=314344 RepID=Q0EZ26_9PROT|nr:Peptidase M14, carboxypeptidase A [Mariprofundus ferrooxydans PV-1]KON48794.1 peptidase M14 [Mariprofundus ferrooxydans]